MTCGRTIVIELNGEPAGSITGSVHAGADILSTNVGVFSGRGIAWATHCAFAGGRLPCAASRTADRYPIVAAVAIIVYYMLAELGKCTGVARRLGQSRGGRHVDVLGLHPGDAADRKAACRFIERQDAASTGLLRRDF